MNAFDSLNQNMLLAKPVSRRLFISASAVVGALTFKGSVLEGTLQAWADESGQQHFVIYVLSKTEVPIMVYDVSGADPVPVAGCSVTVGSWYAETSQTVVTDESGFAPMDVKALSFQRDDDAASVYNFWGYVSAEKDGYRHFYEGNVWVEAGTPTAEDGSRPNTIEVPTQPTDGTPYLRAFMMDEADIQYARGLSGGTRETNGEDQVITLQVAAGRAGAQVEAALLVNGEEAARMTATALAEAPHVAELSFADRWLALLKPGDELSARFGIQGETTYSLTSPLTFEESLLLNEDGAIENLPISPGLSSDQTPETREPVVMPEWMGRKGDGAFLNFVFVPVQLFFDDAGRFGLVATLLQVDFLKSRNGKDLLKDGDKKRVNHLVSLSGKQAYENFCASSKWWFGNLLEAYGKGDGGSEGGSGSEGGGGSAGSQGGSTADSSLKAFGVSKLTRDISARFSLSAMGYGNVKKGSKTGTLYTTLDAGLCADLFVGFSFTQHFVLCYVPMYWSFDVSAAIKAKLLLGMTFENCFENIDWAHHFPGDIPGVAFVVAIHLEVGLSVGVGIAGVCSVGIRGYGYFHMDFTFDQAANKPYPLMKFYLGCGVQVIAQFLFFKAVTTPVAPDDWVLYDNTTSTQNALTEQLENAGQAPDFFELSAQDMQLVTDADLAACREARGTWSATDATRLRSPRFGSVSVRAEALARLKGAKASARNPFHRLQEEASYNVVNGLKPSLEELLWEGCYSNPRLRIVHTSEDGFADDSCFMIRLAAVDVEVPSSVSAFNSAAFWRADRTGVYRAEDASELTVVSDGLGNCKVVPAIDLDSEAAAGMLQVERGASESATVSRLRLVVSEWDGTNKVWGTAEVVDFIAEGEVYESDRLNVHDVDFDVEALPDGTLLLAITSLTRPDGGAGNHTPLEYEKNQYISLVRWDHANRTALAAGSTRSINTTGRSLFHPRIMRQFFDDGLGNPGQRCLVYSYACEYDDNGRTDCKFAVTAFDGMDGDGTGTAGQHRLTPPIDVFPSSFAKPNPDVLATGTFEVACPDRELFVTDANLGLKRSVAVISWSRAKSSNMEALSFVLSETFGIKKREDGDTVQYEPSVTLHGSLTLPKVPGIAKLSSLDQKGLFSYADTSVPGDTKPLRLVTYSKDDFSLATVQDDTGNTDKTQYFSSFNGRRLYTVRVMNGENPGLSETAAEAVAAGAELSGVSGPYNSPQAGGVTAEAKQVALYQLLEARWVDELQTYYDFYPIAQLDHIPDNIGVIAADDVRTDFTFANVVMGEEAGTVTDFKANLYQVAVPKVMAATCSNASPVSPFAAPGDTCWYTIDVANVGNAPITLIAMTAYTSDGEAFDTNTFADLSQHVQSAPDSVHGVYDENGQLELDENGCGKYEEREDERDTAGILWPGKTRTYKFCFTVPEGATGDVEFSVSIAKVEDHMDDETAKESLQKFREPVALQGPQALPIIRPFAQAAQDGAQAEQVDLDSQESQTEGNVESRLEELVLGGGTTFSTVRHKLGLRIAEGKVNPGSLVDRGAANYAVVGSDGQPVEPDGDYAGSNAGGKKTAATGDASGFSTKVGLTGMMLGAAAAGIAAYERRRAENEGR